MTEAELLTEEIAELDAQIFRLKGSMNRQDNGVKLKTLAIITRLRERCVRARERCVAAAAHQGGAA